MKKSTNCSNRSDLLRSIFLFFFITITVNSFAQSSGAHLIPRQIFIGDRATLILQLPAVEQNKPDIVFSEGSEYLPKDPNIDFHKITLEQRVTGSRLIIEFTPFITGDIELPVVEIGEEDFSDLVRYADFIKHTDLLKPEDLTVTVNSTIDEKSSPVLSGAASTLAIPGTAFLLYGSLTLLVFIILAAILFIFKGRFILKELREKWKRRRLFNSIYKTHKHLHNEITKGSDTRIIIDKLSEEFRTFLSIMSGSNCRAMTASEFKELAQVCPEHVLTLDDRPLFLNTFFKRCDNLRFSGTNINSKDLIQLLDDMMYFLVELENYRENEQKEEAS